MRHRLRQLPAREAERAIRALHANAHGFRRIALFLVFVGLFFSIVFGGADVAFQRTVHQGLENHLSMVREPCALTVMSKLASGKLALVCRAIDGEGCARSCFNRVLCGGGIVADVCCRVVVWGVVRGGSGGRRFGSVSVMSETSHRPLYNHMCRVG